MVYVKQAYGLVDRCGSRVTVSSPGTSYALQRNLFSDLREEKCGMTILRVSIKNTVHIINVYYELSLRSNTPLKNFTAVREGIS